MPALVDTVPLGTNAVVAERVDELAAPAPHLSALVMPRAVPRIRYNFKCERSRDG
jgi:hypothetical protein